MILPKAPGAWHWNECVALISVMGAGNPSHWEELSEAVLVAVCRGSSWQDARAALDATIAVINRLKFAEEAEADLANFAELQAIAFVDEPALWGLDVGVAAATIALSAYGATPVSSFNAARLRLSTPVTRYPHVALFLPKALAVGSHLGVRIRVQEHQSLNRVGNPHRTGK